MWIKKYLGSIGLTLLCSVVSFSAIAAGDNSFVGEVYSINYENKIILVSDAPFYYSPFTRIRSKTAKATEQLSIASINGRWIKVEYSYSEAVNGFMANTIIILPSEPEAGEYSTSD